MTCQSGVRISMSGNFVILLHTGWGEDHFDLMLDTGPALTTWKLPANPATLAPGATLAAEKLPDHRRDYLHIEGPIAEGRGFVQRIESGRFHILGGTTTPQPIRLEGTKINGTFELTPQTHNPEHGTLVRLTD